MRLYQEYHERPLQLPEAYRAYAKWREKQRQPDLKSCVELTLPVLNFIAWDDPDLFEELASQLTLLLYERKLRAENPGSYYRGLQMHLRFLAGDYFKDRRLEFEGYVYDRWYGSPAEIYAGIHQREIEEYQQLGVATRLRFSGKNLEYLQAYYERLRGVSTISEHTLRLRYGLSKEESEQLQQYLEVKLRQFLLELDPVYTQQDRDSSGNILVRSNDEASSVTWAL